MKKNDLYHIVCTKVREKSWHTNSGRNKTDVSRKYDEGAGGGHQAPPLDEKPNIPNVFQTSQQPLVAYFVGGLQLGGRVGAEAPDAPRRRRRRRPVGHTELNKWVNEICNRAFHQNVFAFHISCCARLSSKSRRRVINARDKVS